jgi:hypothetical protein
MTKIIFFLMACANCELEYKTFVKNPSLTCGEQGNKIMSEISRWSDQGNAYFTRDGKLVFGYRCE